MNKLIPFLILLLSMQGFGQDNPTEQAQPIVAEGKLLYKSEMASWYGTDLFLERFKDREKIGGYFSYINNTVPTCIFFSRTDNPRVIGTISFDSAYTVETASVDLTERDFTATEKDLFTIRQIARNEMTTDTMFKFYKGMNFNLIPLINGAEKKVYLLTGPSESGVVIFGNDYLLEFDKANKLTRKKQLHKNIIPIRYDGKEETTENGNVTGTMHSHLPETGDFMTATDICTLMLYAKFAKWESHNVISKNYLNVWNCKTEELAVIPMDTIRKINEDQKRRHGKKNDDKKNK